MLSPRAVISAFFEEALGLDIDSTQLSTAEILAPYTNDELWEIVLKVQALIPHLRPTFLHSFERDAFERVPDVWRDPSIEVAYLSAGHRLPQRLAHAGLFADRVVIGEPSAYLLRGLPSLVQAVQWLRTVMDPLEDGWAVCVDSAIGLGNFRPDLEETYGLPPDYAVAHEWLLASALSQALGRDRAFPVIAPPAQGQQQPPGRAAELAHFQAVFDHLHGSSYEPDAVSRGGWADRVLIGFGSYTEYLDGASVTYLRNSGVRDAVRDWLEVHLVRAVLESKEGRSPEAALDQARKRMAELVSLTEDALFAAQGKSVRERLEQAGIWGSSGLVTGYVGGILSGASTGIAGASAILGLATGAAAGAGAAGAAQPVAVAPGFVQVLGQIHRSRRPPPT